MPSLHTNPQSGYRTDQTPIFEPNYGLVTDDFSSHMLAGTSFARCDSPLVRKLDAKTPQDHKKQWWLS